MSMMKRRAEERARQDELSQIPLFDGLTRGELRVVDRCSTELRLRPGEPIMWEGAAGIEFVVIVEGAAEVKRGGRRIAVLESGSCFGEIALLRKTPRTATVTALTPMRVLVSHPAEFDEMMREIPQLRMRVARYANERLAALMLPVERAG